MISTLPETKPRRERMATSGERSRESAGAVSACTVLAFAAEGGAVSRTAAPGAVSQCKLSGPLSATSLRLEVGEGLPDHSRAVDAGADAHRPAAGGADLEGSGITASAAGTSVMMRRSKLLRCGISLFKPGDGRRKRSLLGLAKLNISECQ